MSDASLPSLHTTDVPRSKYSSLQDWNGVKSTVEDDSSVADHESPPVSSTIPIHHPATASTDMQATGSQLRPSYCLGSSNSPENTSDRPPFTQRQEAPFYIQLTGEDSSSRTEYGNRTLALPNPKYQTPVVPDLTSGRLHYQDTALGSTLPRNQEDSPVSSPAVSNSAASIPAVNEEEPRFYADGSVRLQRTYNHRAISPKFQPQKIEFYVNGRLGIPLRAALTKDYTNFDNGSEFFVCDTFAISMHLEVLGYDHFCKQLRTMDDKKPPGRITIAKLSTQIARGVAKFIQETRGPPAKPEYANWAVRTGYMSIDRLSLLSFKRMSKSSWQPRLTLIK